MDLGEGLADAAMWQPCVPSHHKKAGTPFYKKKCTGSQGDTTSKEGKGARGRRGGGKGRVTPKQLVRGFPAVWEIAHEGSSVLEVSTVKTRFMAREP